MERDQDAQNAGYKPCNFNSHAHVERDKIHYLFVNGIRYFNSHAHVERDFTGIVLTMPVKISTHTLTWSVTHSKKCS